MAAFTYSTYRFDINDSDYIKSLVDTVGNVAIEAITPSFNISLKSRKKVDLNTVYHKRMETHPKYVERATIAELPEMIEELKASPDFPKDLIHFEITLKTNLQATDTFLQNVIPAFQYQPVNKDPKLKGLVDVICEMIEYRTWDNTDSGYVAMSYNSETPVTLKEAWKALHLAYPKVHSSFRAISAFPLPSENCILILLASGKAFRLHYGAECYYYQDHRTWFDRDDGFLTVDTDLELKAAFETWKQNGCKGPVLQAPDIHLDEAPVPVKPPKTHLHEWKPIAKYMTRIIVTASLLALGLWIFGVSLPVVAISGALALTALTLINVRAEAVGCKKALELQNRDVNAGPLSLEAAEGFEIGVEMASKHRPDVVNAWNKYRARPHSLAFLYACDAGRHLAEHVDQKTVDKVRRNIH